MEKTLPCKALNSKGGFNRRSSLEIKTTPTTLLQCQIQCPWVYILMLRVNISIFRHVFECIPMFAPGSPGRVCHTEHDFIKSRGNFRGGMRATTVFSQQEHFGMSYK